MAIAEELAQEEEVALIAALAAGTTTRLLHPSADVV